MKNEPEKIPFQKVTFTIPADLLDKIDRAAAADRRSRSQWMALQLEAMLPPALEPVESDAADPAKMRPAG
jgi:hypothetical protein